MMYKSEKYFMEMRDEGLIKPACSSGKRRKAEKLITASSAELLYLEQDK